MRLFLALELGAALHRRVEAIQAALKEGSTGWRWVRPDGIHLTIRFLGEVDAEADSRARPGWRRAASSVEPLELALEGLGSFPSGRRPRVLWLGVRGRPPGVLEELAAAVEGEATRAGFAPEPRPFKPHLTLARAGRGERPRWSPPEVPVHELPSPVVELVLFQSRLGPAGARYTALERFPLGAAGPGKRDSASRSDER